MVELVIKYNESVEKNAGHYFEKAKKIKKKIEGIHEIILETNRKIELLDKKQLKLRKEESKTIKRDKAWFEKFKWTITSSGKLVIAGRDATTNDILIKKHREPQDIVFHADIAGSPFCIVKGGKDITDEEINEVAEFCASHSKAFSLGLSLVEVYWVNQDQVSLVAPHGEYLTKGSFMIKGKKHILNVPVQLTVGIDKNGRVIGGHKQSITKHCTSFVTIKPGRMKKSDLAKKIQHHFVKQSKLKPTLDDIIQILPSGHGSISK